jgi:SPP1 gp7 family putative phage head morphogenesis protein
VADIYTQAQDFRERLLARERAASAEVARAYLKALQSVNPQIEALREQIAAARRREATVGEIVNLPWLLAQQERLEALTRQITTEVERFAGPAARITTDAQREAAGQGEDSARELIATATNGARVSFATSPGSLLASRAVEQLVGFSSDGSPLADLFGSLGPAAAHAVRDQLTTGVALGWHADKIARGMREAFGGSAVRALTVTRTETLRAYREASRLTYDENRDIVAGYVWTCSFSSRTCALCWAMSGRVFQTNEVFGTHPNCRCVMIPHARENPADVRPGPELFDKLDDSTKRDILGPRKFEAYKAGRFTLPQLVGERVDARWGLVRFERSLKDVIRVPRPAPLPPTVKPRVPVQPRPSPVAASAPHSAPGEVSTAKGREGLQPAGVPVTKALKLETKNKKVAHALGVIDSVHGDGALPEIPLKQNAGTKTLGSFSYDLAGRPLRIVVSSKGNHPGLTAAHEIGHFLDHDGANTEHAPAGRYLSKSNDPLIQGWAKAVGESRAVKRLRELANTATVEVERDGVKRAYRTDRRYIRYLLQPHEIFARSYAQYIAHRSQDPQLRAELDAVRGSGSGIYPTQWADDEFEAIAVEFDKLFAALGWLK